MIVVTHEMAFARDVADRVVVMDAGQVVEQGPPRKSCCAKNPRTASFLSRFHSTSASAKVSGPPNGEERYMFPSKGKSDDLLRPRGLPDEARFELRNTGIELPGRGLRRLQKRIGEADVVVVSGMWQNDLIPHAPTARIHPVDQRGHRPVFERSSSRAQGIRLASAPASMPTPSPSMRWR